MDKQQYNRNYNDIHKPFPVRLDFLKDFLREDAIENDLTLHECIVKKLQSEYREKILIKAAEVAEYADAVYALLQQGHEFSAAAGILRVNERLLIIGMSKEQCDKMCEILNYRTVRSIKRIRKVMALAV